MNNDLPPKEKSIEPPAGGWVEHRYYVADVSFGPSNPIFRAILSIGYLNGTNDGPGSYSEAWNVSMEPARFSDLHYLRIISEISDMRGE